jgi:hypothetical protein
LPEDSALAATAAALRDTGQWADIVDRQWWCVYSTDDQRRIYGGLLELAAVALGSHYFGPEAMRVRLGWRSGPNSRELTRELFAAFGGLVLTDTPGGAKELSGLVDPALRDLVGGFEPAADAPALPIAWRGNIVGRPVSALTFAVRIHDAQGDRAGTALISKPGAGMAVVATVASAGDHGAGAGIDLRRRRPPHHRRHRQPLHLRRRGCARDGGWLRRHGAVPGPTSGSKSWVRPKIPAQLPWAGRPRREPTRPSFDGAAVGDFDVQAVRAALTAAV